MSIYQHFRPEEREFIEQVLSWKEYVHQTYSPKLTDFLDPRETQIVKLIIGSESDVQCDFFGGSNYRERNRALIYPDYYQVNKDDYRIILFEVDYARKFTSLTHPSVLGSLMGLGLKRGKFGDIIIVGDNVQFYCAEEVSEYVLLELKQVGKSKVSLESLPLSKALLVEEGWSEQMITVSSLRFDAIVSAIFNISRQKSQTLIGSGLAKVNWTKIENPSFECGVGDTISIRGFGRSKVIAIEGKTKKEKWRMTVGKQK